MKPTTSPDARLQSFVACYWSTSSKPLLGGVMRSRSSRWGTAEEAARYLAVVMELNGPECKGDVIKVAGYPEIFVHCGTDNQSIGSLCPGCRKRVTIKDAKEFCLRTNTEARRGS